MLQGAARFECIRAIREDRWMQRLSDVKETEQLLMEEAEHQEKEHDKP